MSQTDTIEQAPRYCWCGCYFGQPPGPTYHGGAWHYWDEPCHGSEDYTS